jgi:hypothetical protein
MTEGHLIVLGIIFASSSNLGADFAFAAGTIFVSGVALPSKPSLEGALYNQVFGFTTGSYIRLGALFQAMTRVCYFLISFVDTCTEHYQIGTSALAITSIMFDKVLAQDLKHLQFTETNSDTTDPKISRYRVAQWTALVFKLCFERVCVWLLSNCCSLLHGLGYTSCERYHWALETGTAALV